MNEYGIRRARLQRRLAEEGIDAMLLTQNVDLYYFTGTMQTGYALIPSEGETILYVKRSVGRATEEADCEVRELGSFRGFGERLKADYPRLGQAGGRIASEFDVLPVQIYLRLKGLLPELEWADGSTIVRELRMIKSPEEIRRIGEAAAVVDDALEFALARLQAGMTELAFVGLIERRMRELGHSGLMRMRGYNQELVTGMVGAGAAAATPTYFDGPAGGLGLSAAAPQGSSLRPIERNEPILIDIGCCLDGYVIDQTRTAVIGTLPDDLEQAYRSAEAVLRATEARLRPGTVCEQLYEDALELVRGMGLDRHFMGYGADQVKFLGHGIGLEIDELPVLARGFRTKLEPGMVIAIEPKFTFPGRGVVGIEDTYAVTEAGFERITKTAQSLITLP